MDSHVNNEPRMLEDEHSLDFESDASIIIINNDHRKACWLGFSIRAWMFSALGVLSIVIISLLVFRHGRSSSNSPSRPIVILISMDGFRHDYLASQSLPSFENMIKQGTFVKSLIPVFPSKTFTNHYTLVTGLYSENHGIVENEFYDPHLEKEFDIRVSDEWWGGEPIWLTAEFQGLKSACFFWPGSEATIKGKRPTYFEKFNESLEWKARVNGVLDWIDLPEDERPSFISLYFEEPDKSGHWYGPSSKEVLIKIKELDELLGELMTALEKRTELSGRLNLVVLTDHGMAEINKYIYLDDYIDLESIKGDINIVTYSPLFQVWPTSGNLQDPILDHIFSNLSNAHPNMTCYIHRIVPEELHYSKNERISPLLCIMDEGYELRTTKSWSHFKGNHGFYSTYSTMHGMMIAHGPAFPKGNVVEELHNVNVYDLLCHILGLKPAYNNGDQEWKQLLHK